MPVLDFQEIEKAKSNNGLQDSFELFSRDFFDFMGFKIIQDPNRGQDGGADLILEETRNGIIGETKFQWLVSCKHYAHSGVSVGVKDEEDVIGRVQSKKCLGFIGFYSTLASSGLAEKLNGYKDRISFQVFDREKIERHLLSSSTGIKLASRYFPNSIKNWRAQNSAPEKYFWDFPPLICDCCGRNLLDPKPTGIVTIWETFHDDISDKSPTQILDLYFSCKGICDRKLENVFYNKYQKASDGWEDISDLCIPTIYFKWLCHFHHELNTVGTITKTAFKKYQHFFASVFPYVSRQLSKNEKSTIKSLQMIPSFLGGMGYE